MSQDPDSVMFWSFLADNYRNKLIFQIQLLCIENTEYILLTKKWSEDLAVGIGVWYKKSSGLKSELSQLSAGAWPTCLWALENAVGQPVSEAPSSPTVWL